MHPLARLIYGQRFGRLEALRPTTLRKRGSVVWEFRCDCGKIVERPVGEVSRGNTASCGCLRNEVQGAHIRSVNVSRTQHGHRRRGSMRSPTLISWENMHQRCGDPKHRSFLKYGGRGIVVCKRWAKFANFLADMGERPPGTTIDRIDGMKGYEPDNCRWATPVEQANNVSTNRSVTHAGRTQNLKQWAAEIGVSHQALAYRLDAGWSVEEAFTTPLDRGSAWRRGTRKSN